MYWTRLFLRLQAIYQLCILYNQHNLTHSTRMLFSIGINHNRNTFAINKHFDNKRSKTIINNIQWQIGVESGKVKRFDTACYFYIRNLIKELIWVIYTPIIRNAPLITWRIFFAKRFSHTIHIRYVNIVYIARSNMHHVLLITSNAY